VKLPGAEKATIDPRKLRDYLLPPVHPVGRHKPAFLASLGYSRRGWRKLEADLAAFALTNDARPGRSTAYGHKYEIRGTLRGPKGKSAEVLTVWFIPRGGNTPRFVTA
jgi:filamentous hemagglutinin